MTLRFMVLAQPRSRSKWLSEYLSYGHSRCGHDLVLGCSSVDEYVQRLEDFTGTVETSLATSHRVWKTLFPRAKFITLRRDLNDIGASFRRLDLVPDWQFLLKQDWALTTIDGLSLTYNELDSIDIRKRLVSYIGSTFDYEWDSDLACSPITIDAQQRLRDLEANREATLSFNRELEAILQ